VLVGVASYPRSGNTLTLRTLYDAFGVNRFCTVHEPDLWMRKRNRGYEIPAELDGLEGSELLEALRERPEPFFIKSHRRKDSEDAAPALYIARDGRDVHVSYAHWIEGRENFRVRGEPIGHAPFRERLQAVVSRRSWSRHVNAWRTRSAPTAIVRYEELAADPAGTVKRACEQLDVPLPEQTGEPVPFSVLHKRNPALYRRGQAGAWRDEMPSETEERFWRLHGDEMRALGYGEPAVAHQS
jgi:hypothetical protein